MPGLIRRASSVGAGPDLALELIEFIPAREKAMLDLIAAPRSPTAARLTLHASVSPFGNGFPPSLLSAAVKGVDAAPQRREN